MSDVLISGCGLIGTSIGLALQGSALGDVTLHDINPEACEQAVRRGAGRQWDGVEPARVVVVAIAPARTPDQLLELQGLKVGATYTHVASVQSQVQAQIESLSSDSSQVVGGHPLAGREVSGPSAALSDLFVGRPWAICPGASSALGAVDDVRELAEVCGAVPLVCSPAEHDQAVALLSHVPQVVSSALAALVASTSAAAETGGVPLALSGPGLADTTRLAASSPELWSQVLAANARHVAPLVAELGLSLSRFGDAVGVLADESSDEGAKTAAAQDVAALLSQGNVGRRLVPVKRGIGSEAFSGVRVDVSDEPGQLARLLTDAGAAGVNVEDLQIDHVPGRPRGVIELLVDADAAGTLAAALEATGWKVLAQQ